MSKSSDGDESCNDGTIDEELSIGFWNKRASKGENPGNSIPIRKIYVTNVHGSTRHTELKEFFSKFGKVVEAYVRSGRKTYKRSQYYAFVTFEKPEDAEKAITARRAQLKLRDRVMYVSAANYKHQPDKGDKPQISAKQKFFSHIDRTTPLEDFECEDGRFLTRERPCKINDLNDDCLALIFSYFGIKEKLCLELVCKRWRVVLLDQWMRVTHLDFQHGTDLGVLTDSILGKILQRCGMSLLKLDLPVSHALSGDSIHVIASLCRNLEHLSAHALRVTTSAINQFTLKCKNLKSLVLREPISIRDRDIQILFQKLRLESFCLTQHNIDGLCLASLPRTLRHLDLTSCNELMMSSLISGLSSTNSLRSLKLDHCANLTKTDFELVCSKIPYIEELSVAEYFPNLSGTALDAIKQLGNLRKLDVNLNELVDDRLVILISTNCKKLEILDISGCRGTSSMKGVTDVGIAAIAQNTNIIDLSMSYLDGVSDEALFSLAEAGKLKRLHCLGCPGITDNGSSRLISLCLELELLDISGCSNITWETTNMAVKTLSLRPDAKKLHLIVGGTKVTDHQIPVPNSSLKVDMANNCVDRLRPDFSHDSLFESSDDDDYGLDEDDSVDDDPFEYPYEFDSENGYSDAELQEWQ